MERNPVSEASVYLELCRLTGSQALPGNLRPEALPRLQAGKLEAEPTDVRYQAEPGNE
ncbi:MAG: hypothetical protein ACBR13_13635 [Microcoleus sp.]